MSADTAAALSLLNAAAVRARAQRLFDIGLAGKLPNFRIELERFGDAVDLVVATIRKNYPTLKVPFHSRWRHFVTHGFDRYAELAEDFTDPMARARSAFDLAIVSVLLDAGAGPQWRYRDPIKGGDYGRSEGLALASFMMFAAGDFSSVASIAHDSADKFRVDADALVNLDIET